MEMYNLWIASCKIPNKIKNKLLRDIGSPEEIFNYIFYSEKSIYPYGIDDKIRDLLKNTWNKIEIENAAKILRREGAHCINANEDKYPLQLKNFNDSPAILFYLGNIDALNNKKSVAIVGSRKCSIYGRNCASLISKELAYNNINVVSGLAKGIDGFAHEACIKENGFTCAILGCGIDVIYPRENSKLYRKISEEGCVISEFMPKTKPLSYNFPIRNRIISALSSVVVVVEAGEKSGSLITGSIALEQGRDVIAVPGSIFSSESKGTNKLIKEGAYVFTEIEDIFKLLKIEYKNNKNLNKNKSQGIYNVISSVVGDTPIHIDEIFERCNIDIKRLYELLFELQLRDEIICLSGNYYVKSRSTT